MTYTVQQTQLFTQWHAGLRDMRARISIARHIERASAGNLGDVKTVGEGVSEMRIDVGAGYRIYFTTRNRMIIVLLVGGDKSTQSADVKHARLLAKEI